MKKESNTISKAKINNDIENNSEVIEEESIKKLNLI